MSKQLFHADDLVQVAKDLGPSMSHFTADCRAIVIGSYCDLYGGNRDCHTYSLYLEGRGECSWYEEWQLTLIEHNQQVLLQEWRAARDKKIAQESDLDWIFANGAQVLKSASGASIEALGAKLGIDNLWGSMGEGITYYSNAIAILAYCEPFLRSGDKAAFLASTMVKS